MPLLRCVAQKLVLLVGEYQATRVSDALEHTGVESGADLKQVLRNGE